MFQPGVGELSPAEEQRFEAGQPLETFQPGVGDLGVFKLKRAESKWSYRAGNRGRYTSSDSQLQRPWRGESGSTGVGRMWVIS
jgi:hypothetical protein